MACRNKCVNNLQPWFQKDLETKGLADRLCEVEQLRFLYPNIDKMEAFLPHLQEKQAMPEGLTGDYLPSIEMTTIMSQMGGMSMN